MAYSRANIPAAELAALALDKPMLVGAAPLRLTSNSVTWSTSQASTGDNGAASYPSSRLDDGFDHLQSRPASGATTQWIKGYMVGTACDFDTIAMLNCSLPNCTGATLYVADDNALSSNVWSTAWTQGTSEDYATQVVDFANRSRIVLHNLMASGTPQRITSGVYFGLKLTFSGSTTPSVGEFILGRRRQLYNAPEVPWSRFNLESTGERVETRSGVVVQYVHTTSRRKLEANIRTGSTTRADDLEAFWNTDIRGGRDAFLWVDRPYTAQHNAPLMRLNPLAISGEYQGPFEQTWQISATECGPNYQAND